jgi:hypothetical protein
MELVFTVMVKMGMGPAEAAAHNDTRAAKIMTFETQPRSCMGSMISSVERTTAKCSNLIPINSG